MDRLTAHLDRGWDLAQSGDARGAAESARQAIELAPDSPEAFNLLGYASALDGDSDEALDAYQHAIALDDGYVEAMLNAAELLVHPMRDFEQALELCDRILDITEYDDELLDAQLLKFEAFWALGQDAEAREVVGKLPKGPLESAAQSFLVARACIEVGELARARPLMDLALEGEPNNPETNYYAGLLAEAEGNKQRACVHFLRARQLESEGGLPSWSPNEQAFMTFVQRASDALPTEQQELLKDSEVFVVDLPGAEMLIDGVDLHSLVVVDLLNAHVVSGPRLETMRLRVFLYAINILRAAGSLDEVETTIREGLAKELSALLDELRTRDDSN